MSVIDDSMAPLYRKGDRFRLRTEMETWRGTDYNPCDVVAYIVDKDIAVLRRYVMRPRGKAFELMPLSDDHPSESSVPSGRIIVVGVVAVHLRRALPINYD